MKPTLALVCFAALAGGAFVSCGKGEAGSDGVRLIALAVTPTNPTRALGSLEQFTAIGLYSDDTVQDLTSSIDWSSSNPAICSVSQGLASTAAVGTTTIVVQDPTSLLSGATTFTVTAAKLTSIAVTPTYPSMALGTTQQCSAVGNYSDGTIQDISHAVIWSSSGATTVDVSNTAGSTGVATGLSLGAATIIATDAVSNIAGAASVVVTPATLVTLSVTPPHPSLALGTAGQLVAIGAYSDASTQNVTSSVTWSSADPAVALVSNAAGSNGLVTSVAPGSTTITATDVASGIANVAAITVSGAELTSIEVTPIHSTLPLGLTRQFTATGTYSDQSTQDITDSVTWISTSAATAAVSNAAGSRGLATSIAVGGTTIRAVDPASGVSGATTLDISAATLTSIAVSPTSPTIALGTEQQFFATGIYSDGSTQNLTSSVTWSSSNAAIASVSNAPGSNGLGGSLAAGSAGIRATDPASGVTDATTLTVTSAVLVSISVTPASPSIAVGTTRQFAATGTFSDATTQDITNSVTWSTSNAAVASIGNTSGGYGLGEGLAVGSTLIAATDPTSGIGGDAVLHVSAAQLIAISVTPSDAAIALGNTQQLVAIGTYSDSSTQNITSSVTWSTSEAFIAAVSNVEGANGRCTGLAVGVATLGATEPSSGVSGATTVTVSGAVLTSIEVTPAHSSLAAGTSRQFAATGVYSDATTADLTNSVTWASSNSAAATVSNALVDIGLVTSNIPGSTQIEAFEPATGSSGSTTLHISPAVLNTLAINPVDPSMALGTAQQLVAIGTYSDGSTVNITSSVTWGSSDEAVAVVSNAAGSNGFAASLATGATSISAIDPSSGIGNATILTVTAAVLTSITITPVNPSIARGTTQTFTATGNYGDGSTQDLSSVVTWSSSDTQVATLSNVPGSSGLATSHAVGSTTVTAIDPTSGIEASTSLTVTAAVLSSLNITPTDPSISTATTQQCVATGVYTDGATQNLTSSVTWSSSNLAAATVSNAAGSNGLATSIAVGTSTISATDPLTGIAATTTLTVEDITFRGAASAGAASGVLGLTIWTPAGVSTGDVLVAAIAVRPRTATLTPPGAGWTLVRRMDNTAGSSTNSLAVYTRVATASEPASHTWTLSTSSGSAGGIAAFRTVSTSSPVHVESGLTTASSLTHTAPSVTTTLPTTMHITSHAFASAATWTPPAAMTEAFDVASQAVGSTNGVSVCLTFAFRAAVGATGARSAVASNNADRGNTHSLVLRRAP